MSFECRYMLRGKCQKRGKDCQPGEPGCVIYGRFETPLAEKPYKYKKSAKKK